MRKIWATVERWPFTQTTLDAASASGAIEVVQIPCPSLPMLSEGYNEIDDGMADAVRASRDAKLAATDWRVIRAVETNTPMTAEWETYRQALRDITLQPGFPADVAWPVEPT